MKTYTIYRDDQEIGRVSAATRRDAARIFASRMTRLAIADQLADGTYQAIDYRPKLARWETVDQPFTVEV